MKRTLIFLSFFFLCFATAFAKNDTGYTQKDTIITMHSLFPPMFSDVETKVSLVNGATSSEKIVSPVEFSWLYLIFCMILPTLGILFISIKIPKEKTKYLVLFYLCFVICAFTVAAEHRLLFCLFTCVFSFALATFANFSRGLRTIPLVYVICLATAFSSFFVSVNLKMQYIIFIVVCCGVSYMVRHLYFKHREKKEIIQATV